ncbi:DUF551 domain-containing protein [Massilistercora timonensis]|uniref:DUF551 domain-containing protein n=1 Tax=Massilistercora timonensis TaxID=2086584 RepID=UPI003AB769A7
MERLTIPDEKIEGGVRRAVIDARKVKEHAMTIYWALKKYEDTGLSPQETMRLKEHMNDGWIPVEERLPEEFTPVLVTAIQESRKPGWDKRKDFLVVVDTDVYDSEISSGWEGYKDKVLAWRPLPEPYCPERSKR